MKRANVGPTKGSGGTRGSITSRDRVRIARLPMHFFTVAVAFFGLAIAAAPWVVGDLVEFFYQPVLLALTHAITLGWITSAIMGVMYRYVPALTNPLRILPGGSSKA